VEGGGVPIQAARIRKSLIERAKGTPAEKGSRKEKKGKAPSGGTTQGGQGKKIQPSLPKDTINNLSWRKRRRERSLTETARGKKLFPCCTRGKGCPAPRAVQHGVGEQGQKREKRSLSQREKEKALRALSVLPSAVTMGKGGRQKNRTREGEVVPFYLKTVCREPWPHLPSPQVKTEEGLKSGAKDGTSWCWVQLKR